MVIWCEHENSTPPAWRARRGQNTFIVDQLVSGEHVLRGSVFSCRSSECRHILAGNLLDTGVDFTDVPSSLIAKIVVMHQEVERDAAAAAAEARLLVTRERR